MRPALLTLTAWVLLMIGPLPLATAQTAPKMIAHLRADGNYTKDPKDVVKADVKVAPRKDKALLMSGKYAPGEFVTDFRLHVPRLNYDSFTVVTRLKLDDSDKEIMAIVYGGEGYRWAGLDRFKDGGTLSVRMNGGRFQKPTNVVTKTGEWLTLALSVDLKGKKVTVAVNGVADEVSLPDDFRLAVLGTDAEKREKTILFTDFSTGTCLKGLVEELTVYDRAMTKTETETATKPKAKK